MRTYYIVFLLLIFGSSIVLSSCSDSSAPNTSDGKNSTIDSGSYGDATISIHDSASFTVTDNFFCYDTTDHSFRLLMQKDSTFMMSVVFEHMDLKTGPHNSPPDTGWVDLYSLSSSYSALFPFSGSLEMNITKMDLATHTFSAIFSVHPSALFPTENSIDSIRITNGHFIIVPYGEKPVFSFEFDKNPFKDRQGVITGGNLTAGLSNIIQIQLGIPNQDGYRQLRLRLPYYILTPPYTIPYVDIAYYTRDYNPSHSNYYDSSFHSFPQIGSVTVASYDKHRRIISGKFNTEMVNDNARNTFELTNGIFTNIFLEPN